jgi:NTE family protein
MYNLIMKENKQNIGLALGSGGARGLAHIGIIKVLLKNNIPIDYISGSSIGALVGAYLAVFGEVDSLEELLYKNGKELLPLFFDFSLQNGFMGGVTFFLEKVFGDKKFSETKTPLFIITTDLISGKPVIFSSGEIVPAIRGSISVPIVFKPFNYQNQVLVDGGLSDPVPVEILKHNGAKKVIAVNLYHKNEFEKEKFTLSKIAMRSTRIALYNLSKISVKHADIVLKPDTSMYLNKLKKIDFIKKENIKKMIEIGENEAIYNLPEIKKLENEKRLIKTKAE